MMGFESLSPIVQAIILVGVILIEAVVLYVGYGAIERVTAPKIRQAIRDQ